ncbi:hypothetical protein [Kitasatospora griseola]|nr:hypothetical protein [Kitasatospora griseola]
MRITAKPVARACRALGRHPVVQTVVLVLLREALSPVVQATVDLLLKH